MRTISTGACLALVLVTVGCCNPGNIGSVPVTLNAQQTGMWCWAASGQMTMNFLHSASNVQQCDEANKRFGRTDCCNSPRPAACVSTGWPEFDKYGFTFNRTSNTALTWDQLKEQIYCKKKPFAFSWHWSGGGGHMMVVKGYVELDGTHYVYYDNPLPVGVGTVSAGAHARSSA